MRLHSSWLGMVGALALGAPLAASAAPAGPITRVVVYADRAEVTRSAQAACSGDKLALAFGPLPLSVDPRTLRAEAAGRATAIGVTSRTIALDVDRDERVAGLRKELQALDDRLRAAGDELAGLQQRLDGLGAFAAYFGELLGEDLRSAKPDTGRWAQALDLLAGERQAVTDRHLALRAQARALQRQRDLLQRRLDNFAPESLPEGLAVEVAVACNGEPRPTVLLSYVVGQATWQPEYDLRFAPAGGARVGGGTVELTVAAVVRQSSGEDWDGVRLVLSTAKPKLGAEAPYPARLTLQGRPAGDEKVLVQAQERREQLRGEGERREGGPQSVELEDRGTSVALTVPRAVTVKADGRPYWMPVDVASGPAESRLVTIPKLRPYVYQVVRFKNPARYPLLAGRLHTYRHGTYVGDNQLSYCAAGEPIEVSLGIDEELRVERGTIAELDRGPGLLGSTKAMERAYRVKLTNTSTAGQRVEVRENVPVSKSDEVLVELVKDKTSAGYSHDQERGLLTWTIELKPGEKRAVDLVFAIRLPDSWQVR